MKHEPLRVHSTAGELAKVLHYAYTVPYWDIGQVVKDWPAHWQKVRLWQTLRADGGNLGLNVDDNQDAVLARRNALAAACGWPLVWLNQVHEKAVLGVDAYTPLPILDAALPWATADAAVCCQNNIGLTVLTADCLPVVLVAFVCGLGGLQPKAVGIAHAGWKGLAAGVLDSTVEALRGVVMNTKNESIRLEAWLGPAIGPSVFEVGLEVQAVFEARFGQQALEAFKARGNEKKLCNIYALAKLALADLGVACLSSENKIGECTFTELHWYSHRRAQHLREVQGRMATVVGLMS